MLSFAFPPPFTPELVSLTMSMKEPPLLPADVKDLFLVTLGLGVPIEPSVLFSGGLATIAPALPTPPRLTDLGISKDIFRPPSVPALAAASSDLSFLAMPEMSKLFTSSSSASPSWVLTPTPLPIGEALSSGGTSASTSWARATSSSLLLIFSSRRVISAPPLQHPYLLDSLNKLIMKVKSFFLTDSPMSSPSLTLTAALLRFSFTRSC
mmetsp:Transcript_21551/g.44945  ORF Transcript_21551/g.44945 Transcript_21551/m.44945 type:complete len:209 (-) Transcript_21551:189-815(-)